MAEWCPNALTVSRNADTRLVILVGGSFSRTWIAVRSLRRICDGDWIRRRTQRTRPSVDWRRDHLMPLHQNKKPGGWRRLKEPL